MLFKKSQKTDLLVVSFFVFLSLAMTYPLLFHLTDHVPSDLSDPLYNVWVMAWDLHKFGSGLEGFWDTNIFYPHQGTLLYADSLLALAFLSAPLTLLSRNPILSYNILFILSFFLCASGMYVLVLRLTASRTAAVISGLVFAFFPYRFAHISHLELLYFAWMPFCLLFIHRFFESPTCRNLFGIGFFYLLQVYSCAYYGQYLTLLAGIIILYFALKKGFFRQVSFWLKMGILAASCAAILFPYVYSFILVHQKMLFFRPLWEVKHFSAELQHFLAVPPWNFAWGWLTGSLGAQEWQLYPGVLPVFLTFFWIIKRWKETKNEIQFHRAKKRKRIFFWWDAANVLWLAFILFVGISGGFKARLGSLSFSAHKLQNPLLILIFSFCLRVILDTRLRYRLKKSLPAMNLSQRFYLFTIILAWLLSFGPVIRCLGREIIAGPYGLLYKWIPGFQGLRVPSRFAVLMMLGVSVLSGWGTVIFMEKWKSSRVKILIMSLLCLLILLDYTSFPIPLARVNVGEKIPAIYFKVKNLPEEAALVELPMPEHDWDEFQEAIYVFYSLYHRKKIVNGYSGYSPPGYRIVREGMENFPSLLTFELLQNLGLSHILVHTQGFRPERGKEIVRRLRKLENRVQIIEKIQGDFLYRIIPQEKVREEEEALQVIGDRKIWRAECSKNKDKAGLAFDGDLISGWTTGYPQQRGDFFLLDLGSIVSLKKVELYLNNNPVDFPRSFVVEGSPDGVTYFHLSEFSGFFPMLTQAMVEDFSKYVVNITFEPCQLRYLRITLTRSHEARHWSINEIVCKK